jgi:hypothetical protein
MIKPDTISFRATVSEEEIRKRMADEVLESIGGLDANGRPLPGVAAKVSRGDSRKGGYTIDVTGPMPVRMMLPRPGDSE